MTPLKRLFEQLEKDDYSCNYFEEPQETLRVVLQGKEIPEDCALDVTMTPSAVDEEAPLRFQYHLHLPLTISDWVLNDLSALLNFINIRLEIPGFFIDELEESLFFRYMHFTPRAHIDYSLLADLCGMIEVIARLLLPPIQSVASGQKSFDDLLDDLVEDCQRLRKRSFK